MRTPESFITYTPCGVGVTCALFYVEQDNDVYGWWIGARDSEYHSAYFKLENFFTTTPTRFYATDGMDLYGGWKFLYSSSEPALDKPAPVDQRVSHELDRLQEMFVAEWLFFEGDADAAVERKAYDDLDFPLHQHVNIRSKRFNKFDETQPVWRYLSHGFDMDVIDYMQRYWPLDYRLS